MTTNYSASLLSLTRLALSGSSYQQFFYGLTPFAAILLFKFFLQQVKNNQLIIDNSIDVIKIARRRYQTRRLLPRVEDPAHEADFILKVDQGKHFNHQVAGHSTQVMLRHKDMILKPLNKLNLFLREVKFYEAMASNSPHSAHFPHQFIARYHGVILGENSLGKRTPYLALEDVSKKYKTPCMIDIKMGRETFEPTAPLDKVMRERIKYKYQEKIGFRICGFKVYDSLAQVYQSVGKKFGRSLTPELVEPGLAAFFHNGLGHFRLDVLEQLVQKLELLLQWLLQQNKWHFYCSSLLITYDAEVLSSSARAKTAHVSHRHILQHCLDSRAVEGEEAATGGTLANNHDSKQGPSSWSLRPHLSPPLQELVASSASPACSSKCHDLVDVRMIDHAHTLESAGGTDESYIYSIKSLIWHLELIISNIRAGGVDRYCEPSVLIADALSASQK